MHNRLYNYEANVIRVVDGDTFDLKIDLGLDVSIKIRVRLCDVNTPEVFGVKKESEEYAAGLAASNFVRTLIEGKSVHIETIKDRTEKYGRYLVKITLDTGEDLSQLIIAAGHAK